MIAFPELGTAHYVRVHCSLTAQCTSTPAGCVFAAGEHRLTPLSKSLRSLKGGQS